MKSILFLLLSFVFTLVKANMAYMGPADGQVSGREAIPPVKVLRENLTADLRELPGGKARVFADYRIVNPGKTGTIRFEFVASSKMPVIPEFILDGKLVKYIPVISEYPAAGGSEDAGNKGLPETIIGLDLFQQNGFPRQPIMDQIFTFDVLLTEGMHTLKIGYECIPTGYEEGILRFTAFPYFMGNEKTRQQYDSIFVHVLLPENTDFHANFNYTQSHNELFSANLAGFKASHLMISVFKNITDKIDKSENWVLWLNIALWLILLFISLWIVKRRHEQNKSFGISLSLVLPVSFAVAFVWYFSNQFLFNHYRELYGDFLRGSWGKGYYFLVIPVCIVIGSAIWLAIALIYRFLILGTKWDPLNFIGKNR